jgi:hypothetical protein
MSPVPQASGVAICRALPRVVIIPLVVVLVGCHRESPTAPVGVTAPVKIVLTGTWVGTSPDGLVFSKDVGDFCDHDVRLTLSQSGDTLTGTFTSEARVIPSCYLQSYSTLEITTGQESPAQIYGTVNASIVSLQIIAARLRQGSPVDFRAIVANGFFTTGRLALSGNALISRSWSDTDGNGIPDCELTNDAPNGECGAVFFPDPPPSVSLTASR